MIKKSTIFVLFFSIGLINNTTQAGLALSRMLGASTTQREATGDKVLLNHQLIPRLLFTIDRSGDYHLDLKDISKYALTCKAWRDAICEKLKITITNEEEFEMARKAGVLPCITAIENVSAKLLLSNLYQLKNFTQSIPKGEVLSDYCYNYGHVPHVIIDEYDESKSTGWPIHAGVDRETSNTLLKHFEYLEKKLNIEDIKNISSDVDPEVIEQLQQHFALLQKIYDVKAWEFFKQTA